MHIRLALLMPTVKSFGSMGEVIQISEYLERKAAEIDPDEIRKRLADIAIEKTLLIAEQVRLEKVLDEL